MKHSIIIVAAILTAALPVTGHHSDAALDMNTILRFEGVVTEYSMRNPHTYFTVDTISDAGEAVEWTVQMASALTVTRRGWTQDTLSVGGPGNRRRTSCARRTTLWLDDICRKRRASRSNAVSAGASTDCRYHE